MSGRNEWHYEEDAGEVQEGVHETTETDEHSRSVRFGRVCNQPVYLWNHLTLVSVIRLPLSVNNVYWFCVVVSDRPVLWTL